MSANLTYRFIKWNSISCHAHSVGKIFILHPPRRIAITTALPRGIGSTCLHFSQIFRQSAPLQLKTLPDSEGAPEYMCPSTFECFLRPCEKAKRQNIEHGLFKRKTLELKKCLHFQTLKPFLRVKVMKIYIHWYTTSQHQISCNLGNISEKWKHGPRPPAAMINWIVPFLPTFAIICLEQVEKREVFPTKHEEKHNFVWVSSCLQHCFSSLLQPLHINVGSILFKIWLYVSINRHLSWSNDISNLVRLSLTRSLLPTNFFSSNLDE